MILYNAMKPNDSEIPQTISPEKLRCFGRGQHRRSANAGASRGRTDRF
jgi:hypothetical protein